MKIDDGGEMGRLVEVVAKRQKPNAMMRRANPHFHRWLCMYTIALIGWTCAMAPRAAATRLHDLEGRPGPGKASHALERALRLRAGSDSSPQSTTTTTASQQSTTANKKYTAAAESAMQTVNAFHSSKSSRQQQPLYGHMPNLLSESALMDKETNAIYWQGGGNILSDSLARPYLAGRGVVHVRATILAAALWLWVWGHVARYLALKYFGSSNGGGVQGHSKMLFALPFVSAEGAAPPFLKKIASVLAPIVQFFLLLLQSLLYLRLPEYSTKVLGATILLYLLESWSCSTRRYLSHALNAPAEVEAYLERLRTVEPCVTWKVRCFHYEEREFWKNCRGLLKTWSDWKTKNEVVAGVPVNTGEGSKFSRIGWGKSADAGVNNAMPASSETFGESPPSWMAKQVVTHQAVGNYKFGSWEDHTLASLWKRAPSFSTMSEQAPFSKLTLSKLLVLKDQAAREDYFAQQAAFVMLEGRKDNHAEFATTIEVEGFRPKVLAVRPVRSMSRMTNLSAALFSQHVYVLFTLMGLSLPFRIWFGKHCDEMRVTVVKETSSVDSSTAEADAAAENAKSSWFRGKWGRGPSSAELESKRAQELFRREMQKFSLYEEEPTSFSTTATTTANNLAAEDTTTPDSKTSDEDEVGTDQTVVVPSADPSSTGVEASDNADPVSNVGTAQPSPQDSSVSTQMPPEQPTHSNQDGG